METDSPEKFITKLKRKFKANIPILVLVVLILAVVFIFFFNRIVYLIKPGEAGVYWSLIHGTQVDYVYSEGIHLILPVNKMYIYNVRIQEKAQELNVLSKTGLNVKLYLSIRYKPQYRLLGMLHQRIGFDYVNIVVIPEIEAVLRDVIGRMGSEEIYTTGRLLIVEALNRAIEQVAQRYINVDDVLIKRIELPEKVAEAIRYKIEQKHLVEAHQFVVDKEEKEAERKRVEGRGIRDQFNIIAEALPKDKLLTWKGIGATEEIAKSDNAKVVIIGAGEEGLPIILNAGKD